MAPNPNAKLDTFSFWITEVVLCSSLQHFISSVQKHYQTVSSHLCEEKAGGLWMGGFDLEMCL